MGVTTKVLPYVILFAFAAGANAELVRCTSKDGRSSVIRRDKCDLPDDVRTPVTVKSANPSRPSGAARPSSPVEEAMTAYKGGEFARARELFEPLAQKGDPLAQIMMSDMYKNGRGVRPDNAAAYKWARKAGDQGDPRGQALVAAMMQAGKGTPQDDAGAIPWLEKAAKQGNAIAQMALGSAYLEGRGAPKDEMRGMEWVAKAAEGGEVQAQSLLGLAYREGQPRGWPRDEEKAVLWLRKAATQGDANSAAVLKRMRR